MNIKDLKKFSFTIGDTISDNYDVVATNEGIAVDGEVMATFNGDEEVNSADDLMEVFDNAINSIDYLSDEDKEDLGVVLYNGANLSIEVWWRENYG